MRNNLNLRKAIREAEIEVQKAEEVFNKAEEMEDSIMCVIETEIFKFVEGIKGTCEGDTILMNVLEMLDVWHKVIHSTACAEEALIEKQAILNNLLQDKLG